jgi:hypothetical protein
MSRRRLLLACAVAGIAAVGAYAFASTRGTGSERTAATSGGADAAGDLASSAGLFARLTGLGAPTGDLVVRLFSPHAAVEECVDRCPPELRLVPGAEGARLARRAFEGIAAQVEALAKQPGLEREFAATLGTTIEELRRSAEGKSDRGLRVLLVRGAEGVPRGAAYGVGLSLSDLHDDYFDRNRARKGGGMRILVNRIQGAGDPGEVLGGVIELGGDGVGGTSKAIDLEEVRALRHPLGLHFRDENVPVVGIALSPGGDVFTYGYWGDGLRRLPPDPALREAIEAVLRRL